MNPPSDVSTMSYPILVDGKVKLVKLWYNKKNKRWESGDPPKTETENEWGEITP